MYERLVYLTSWLLCGPRGPLTLRQSGTEKRRLSSAENTSLHTSCSNKPNAFSSTSGPDVNLCIKKKKHFDG